MLKAGLRLYPECMFPKCQFPENVDFPNSTIPALKLTWMPLQKGVYQIPDQRDVELGLFSVGISEFGVKAWSGLLY